MRLLFDENLSHLLVSKLADIYPDSEHVRNIGLKSEDDQKVWEYAIAHGFVIVTKDDDFRQFSVLRGHPPKVIWLTPGNCSTESVEHLLRARHKELVDFYRNAEQSLVMVSV